MKKTFFFSFFFLLNLDGSDRFTKYWYDVQKIKPYLAFREIRLNSLNAILSMVMLWRKFAAGGTVPVFVIYKDKAVFFSHLASTFYCTNFDNYFFNETTNHFK